MMDDSNAQLNDSSVSNEHEDDLSSSKLRTSSPNQTRDEDTSGLLDSDGDAGNEEDDEEAEDDDQEEEEVEEADDDDNEDDAEEEEEEDGEAEDAEQEAENDEENDDDGDLENDDVNGDSKDSTREHDQTASNISLTSKLTIDSDVPRPADSRDQSALLDTSTASQPSDSSGHAKSVEDETEKDSEGANNDTSITSVSDASLQNESITDSPRKAAEVTDRVDQVLGNVTATLTDKGDQAEINATAQAADSKAEIITKPQPEQLPQAATPKPEPKAEVTTKPQPEQLPQAATPKPEPKAEITKPQPEQLPQAAAPKPEPKAEIVPATPQPQSKAEVQKKLPAQFGISWLLEGSEELDIFGDGSLRLQALRSGAERDSRPQMGERVTFNYRIALAESVDLGDSTTIIERRDTVAIIGDGDVLMGIEIALKFIEKGALARVRIASRLAYGALGLPPAVPPNADLFAEIEVCAVDPPINWDQTDQLTKRLFIDAKRQRAQFYDSLGLQSLAATCRTRARDVETLLEQELQKSTDELAKQNPVVTNADFAADEDHGDESSTISAEAEVIEATKPEIEPVVAVSASNTQTQLSASPPRRQEKKTSGRNDFLIVGGAIGLALFAALILRLRSRS